MKLKPPVSPPVKTTGECERCEQIRELYRFEITLVPKHHEMWICEDCGHKLMNSMTRWLEGTDEEVAP
jgi:hypothetical protein